MERNSLYDFRCTGCGTNGAVFLPCEPQKEVVVACASCQEPVTLEISDGDGAPYTDDERLQWWYYSMSAEKWCEPGLVVFLDEAALLLCGYNPDWIRPTDAMAGVVVESMTGVHVRLIKLFEDLKKGEPTTHRTLAQWRDEAKVRRFEYDSRIDDMLQAFAVEGGETDQLSQKTGLARPRPNAESDEVAPVRTHTRKGDKWSDAELLMLLEESRQPGVTHEKMAAKYNVSRQRIQKLLSEGRARFSRPKVSLFPGVEKPSRATKRRMQ